MIGKHKYIKSFTDLTVWQRGHKLVVSIYSVTKLFPREEIYSLTDQMRRCATSITSNIAEGFGRQTYKEKAQFYYMSSGSLSELKNQLLIAKDVGYLKQKDFDNLIESCNEVHKLLNDLIRKTKMYSSKI